jgi:hypothetical protein
MSLKSFCKFPLKGKLNEVVQINPFPEVPDVSLIVFSPALNRGILAYSMDQWHCSKKEHASPPLS